MNLNVNLYMEVILVVVSNFAGAISNDYYNTMTDKDDKIRIGRVLLGTTTGSLVSFVVVNRVTMIKEDGSLFLLFCYLVGIGGFKLFEWLRAVDVVNTLLYMLKIDTTKVKKTEESKEVKDNKNDER